MEICFLAIQGWVCVDSTCIFFNAVFLWSFSLLPAQHHYAFCSRHLAYSSIYNFCSIWGSQDGSVLKAFLAVVAKLSSIKNGH